jgi:hypothetical protein
MVVPPPVLEFLSFAHGPFARHETLKILKLVVAPQFSDLSEGRSLQIAWGQLSTTLKTLKLVVPVPFSKFSKLCSRPLGRRLNFENISDGPATAIFQVSEISPLAFGAATPISPPDGYFPRAKL